MGGRARIPSPIGKRLDARIACFQQGWNVSTITSQSIHPRAHNAVVFVGHDSCSSTLQNHDHNHARDCDAVGSACACSSWTVATDKPYTFEVEFKDGTNRTLSVRERPQLLLSNLVDLCATE